MDDDSEVKCRQLEMMGAGLPSENEQLKAQAQWLNLATKVVHVPHTQLKQYTLLLFSSMAFMEQLPGQQGHRNIYP